jgi:hypothetical protein
MNKIKILSSTDNPVQVGDVVETKVVSPKVSSKGKTDTKSKNNKSKSKQKTTRDLLIDFMQEVRGVFKRNNLK